MKHLPLLAAASVLATLAAPAIAAGDAVAGRAVYQARCAACHALDFNGIGPAHRGVVGRRAGTAPGFVYSDALKAWGRPWDEATLERWLADPEAFAPGQRMGVSLPDPQQRLDVVAYLRAASAAKPN
jgi:cytochrome c